ncbi:MAG: hypothetical protein ABIA75_10980 [Candidatus Neomarinimicrobiota bacterium]
MHLATGNAIVNGSSFFPQGFNSPQPAPGLGCAVGWQTHLDWFLAALEGTYGQISHPDGSEQFEGSHHNVDTVNGDWYATHAILDLSFPQTERQNSEWEIRLILGVLPFKDLNLCLYGSFGIGHGRQSFHSAATEYGDSMGYAVTLASTATWYDMGEYKGAGDWSRSSSTHSFGLGAELFLFKRTSLKLDYKAIKASYTRYDVPVMGNFYVVYYKDQVDYKYTFANVISLGITYYLGM